MNIIDLQNVYKYYDNNPALKGVNLQLEQGSVMGLIGANGSGKTTLLKTALGLLNINQGKALIFNEDAWDLSDSSKDNIGYVAQSLDFFNWMKAKQLIEYTRVFYSNWDMQKANALMFNWDINPEKKIENMSDGQKQRLAIILALSHSPKLLILDEPVASLDPAARRDFIGQLIEMNIDSQTSILFSTHITTDVERVAENVAFLKEGQVVYQGSVDTLKEQVVRLHIQSNNAFTSPLVHPQIIQQKIQKNTACVSFKNFEPKLLSDLEKQLDANIQLERLSLEDIFLELNS